MFRGLQAELNLRHQLVRSERLLQEPDPGSQEPAPGQLIAGVCRHEEHRHLRMGFLALTWPSPPWDVFQIWTVVLMLVSPFAFFPFSKTLFLAFDLLVRPPTDEDFAAPHEVARRHPGEPRR